MLQCLELVQSLPATWHHRVNHCNVHLLQKPRLVLELLLMDRQVERVKEVRGRWGRRGGEGGGGGEGDGRERGVGQQQRGRGGRESDGWQWRKRSRE